MASPQKENGYTPIANEILEALARIRINGEARQILDTIIRKTYGFNKKSDAISLSQFVNATGMKKPTIQRGLCKLKLMNIIIRKDNAIANEYALNKDFDNWKPLSKKITTYLPLSKKIISVIQKDKNRLPKRGIQKTVSKDTITKDIVQTPKQLNKDFFTNIEKQNQLLVFLEGKGIDRELAQSEIRKFISYWTELTPNGKKQLWETKKTFEVKGRLATWFGNIRGNKVEKKGIII